MTKVYAAKDPEVLKKYNILDCVYTARAYGRMRNELIDARQQRLYEHYKALSVLAAKMYRAGFPIDQAVRAELGAELEARYKVKEQEFRDLAGIDPNENQLRSLIWKKHATDKISRFNLPDPYNDKMWSGSGMIKVDYFTLLQLVVNPGIDPALKKVIDAYWDVTGIWKERSTFITSDLLSKAIGPDSRVRAGWNALGADTGRWTCSRPNIQVVPQHLRRMYRTRPGRVFVHADFAQLELQVMSLVAPDATLRKFLDIGDVYSMDAITWFKLPPGTKVKEEKPAARKKCKTIHLGKQYGAGDKTVHLQALADDRSFTWELTQRLSKAFEDTYSGTVSYWAEEEKRVQATGQSESLILGRARVYPRLPERSQIANYPVQSTAADVANLGMLDLDRRLAEIRGAEIVHYFHDAADVECWEDDVEEVKTAMRESFCQPHTIRGRQFCFPLVAPNSDEPEFKVSNDWSKL